MHRDNEEENEDVILLRPYGKKYHRIRITANPADPRTIDVTEDLLSKCEISRCESSNDEGMSVWSLIIEEELVDEALMGIAVVVASEDEFFHDNEGRISLVSQGEIHALGGYAEETALCWEDQGMEEFEEFVHRIIADQLANEIQELIDENPDKDGKLFADVQDRTWTKANLYRWGEEDIREAVREAFEELLDEEDAENGEE